MKKLVLCPKFNIIGNCWVSYSSGPQPPGCRLAHHLLGTRWHSVGEGWASECLQLLSTASSPKPTPPPRSVEKSSFTKLVPGTKKVGTTVLECLWIHLLGQRHLEMAYHIVFQSGLIEACFLDPLICSRATGKALSQVTLVWTCFRDVPF